jgi:hypothetical protein
VTALTGPYGSGKTELAIGLAVWAAQQNGRHGSPVRRTMLGDLDVLKPYFRAREAQMKLRESGVGLIAPAGALAQSDLPILAPELRGSLGRTDTQLILDVGGDPVGARALGSVSDVVGACEHDLLLVLNRYRPFMDSLECVIAQAREIEAASHLQLTGVVSNTHLLDETTREDVEWGLELARQVAQALHLELRLLGIPEGLAPSFENRADLPPLAIVRRQMMPSFLGGVVLAPPRPSLHAD